MQGSSYGILNKVGETVTLQLDDVDSGEPHFNDLQDQMSACESMEALVSMLGSELELHLAVRDRVSLVLVEPDQEWMRIYQLLPVKTGPLFPLARVAMEGTPVGQVVRDGVALVSDAHKDSLVMLGHAARDRIMSTLSVPIHVGARVVGALNAGSRKAGSCTEEMLQEFAAIAAIVGPAFLAAEQAFARRAESQALEAESIAGEELDDAGLIGKSRAFSSVIRSARRTADSDADVVITGETGVGKTAFARAIHHWSRRKDGPFVTVHVADLSPTLIESELFGHTRGAFTGALTNRVGRFESARGGTLFLDEIGETPLPIQAKLLRVIQDRCFERVGSNETITTDVRLVVATSRDLRELIKSGEFREDLYYRLNVVPLCVPPLRERGEDLEELVLSILADLGASSGRHFQIAPEGWARLRAHSWPGNIRELQSVLRRATILEESDTLELRGVLGGDDSQAEAFEASTASWPTLDDHQRDYIRRVLAHCKGVIEGPTGAASLLDMRPSTLRSRMLRLGISMQQVRRQGLIS